MEQSRPGLGERMSNWVLLLTVGLCLSRALMLEIVRDPAPLVPGGEVLKGAGAAVTVILDWLCYLPALLMCARAVLDETFALRWPRSWIPMAALGLWATASIFWSADRYSAAVTSGKLLAGAAMFWAMMQLVRDWRAFRIVMASAAAFLAVLVLHSVLYRAIDVPELKQNWEQNREQILQDRGWPAESLEARRFEAKVLAFELMGFSASSNTLSAVVMLLAMIVAGDLAQRLVGKQGSASWVMPILLLAGAGWVVVAARTRTALGTGVIGILLLLIGWRLRGWMARRRRTTFAAGVVLVLLGIAAVVGHGLYHGSLVERSLTFRWNYWLGSAAMFRNHLLNGVGWGNFGLYYTQYRLPIAPEEISDPHNLFVRYGTELGIVGLLLVLGWVVSLFWDLTKPVREEPPSAPLETADASSIAVVKPFLWIAATATVVSIAGALDGARADFILEAGRRCCYALVVVLVGSLFAAASLRNPQVDDAPSPMLLLGAVAGLTVFFIHGMVDFAFSEAGAWYVFVLVAGSVVGLRLAREPQALGQEPRRVAGLITGLGFGSVAVTMGVLTVVPVALSEAAAHEGDLAYVAQNYPMARKAYADAYGESQWLRNADALLREARAAMGARASTGEVLATLDRAVAANPRLIPLYMTRAGVRAAARVEPEQAVQDYLKVIELNPADARLRVEVGGALASLGRREQALEQYEQALELDSRLPPDEIKRLSSGQVSEIQSRIRQLKGS